MHDIEMQEASEDFARCWQAAGRHLQRQVQDGLSWLKADLAPPFLEHLSFRLGNQLFYIRLEEAEDHLQVPGNRHGLLTVADGCHGHPCLMPMRRRGAAWEPALPGWGLRDLRTGTPVDPPSLVTDARVAMTDWEVHDFAVQVVRDQLRAEGRQIMSSQGNLAVDPSLWFVGDHGPEWVVIRARRYPAPPQPCPANWDAIAARCAWLSPHGHYAPIGVANADKPDAPLWRGHGLQMLFAGMG